MTWADLPQALFELLWPIILLFSVALLVKSVIRRYRINRRLRFKRESLLFYSGTISSVVVQIVTAMLVITPLVDKMVYTCQMEAKYGFYLFWSLLMLGLIAFSLLVTRILCRVWPFDLIPDQDNNV
jgi:hypothetical protein